MMNTLRSAKPWAALLLIGCFLFVSYRVAASVESHHLSEHHDQLTHSTTWCAWACQAGHSLHMDPVVLAGPFTFIEPLPADHPAVFHRVALIRTSSRAPPPDPFS